MRPSGLPEGVDFELVEEDLERADAPPILHLVRAIFRKALYGLLHSQPGLRGD